MSGSPRAIARLRNRKAVNELVAERTRHYVAEELARHLQGSGVAAVAVAHQQEMHTDEHLNARGFFTPITHPAAGTHLYPGPLGKLQHTAGAPFPPGTHPRRAQRIRVQAAHRPVRRAIQSLIDDHVIGTAYLETAHA